MFVIHMVYYKKTMCPVEELGKTVEELANTYNRINIYLPNSKKHREHRLRKDVALIISHKQ